MTTMLGIERCDTGSAAQTHLSKQAGRASGDAQSDQQRAHCPHKRQHKEKSARTLLAPIDASDADSEGVGELAAQSIETHVRRRQR